ncbi:hypothetical protein IJG26_02240 [Candidatus Saccharibacteria bacterium]|nr:hypothetical protein [Candidatus Saccharibacteria bacterium]MBR0415678.1 hypothetical protein [Candidatus Saccharibacteria bacterium]
MDKRELENDHREELVARYKNEFLRFRGIHGRVRLLRPKLNVADEMLEIMSQRRRHKKVILKFLIIFTSIITFLFVALVFAKIFFIAMFGIEIISDVVLNIIAVSFFTELITTVRSISKYLWDDGPFLSSDLLKEIYNKTSLS